MRRDPWTSLRCPHGAACMSPWSVAIEALLKKASRSKRRAARQSSSHTAPSVNGAARAAGRLSSRWIDYSRGGLTWGLAEAFEEAKRGIPLRVIRNTGPRQKLESRREALRHSNGGVSYPGIRSSSVMSQTMMTMARTSRALNPSIRSSFPRRCSKHRR